MKKVLMMDKAGEYFTQQPETPEEIRIMQERYPGTFNDDGSRIIVSEAIAEQTTPAVSPENN